MLNIILKNLKTYSLNLYFLQQKKNKCYYYLNDDITIYACNIFSRLQKKYVANLQISKNIYNRYYFRKFKNLFKLDVFSNFRYCLFYFKFFYFWNFFFLLHWVRYKNVLKKFFYKFFFNQNLILFFLNYHKINIEQDILFLINFSTLVDKIDCYYYLYISLFNEFDNCVIFFNI